jgi:spore maturation protein CgeB
MEYSLKILSVGGFSGYGESNTCLHRTWALEKLGDVDRIDTTSKAYPLFVKIQNRFFQRGVSVPFQDYLSINTKIVDQIGQKKYDLVWIDKGLFINKTTLQKIKKNNPAALIIGYSPDDMSQRHNQSLNFINSLPFYDYFVTTKSYIIEDLKKMGAKEVLFVDNAYEDSFHFPRTLTDYEKQKLGDDVGFIGTWEQERANSILYLARNGIRVRVWGGGKWKDYKNRFQNLTIEDSGLFSEEYSKALGAFKISLCFLRKINSDLQTTRTMEIPACGSFLMAERTIEHERLFKEGKEAAFFSTDEELLQKCQYYLAHETERNVITQAAYLKCIDAGYSNKKSMEAILQKCINKT